MIDRPTVVLLPGSLCDERLFAHQTSELPSLWPVVVADFEHRDSIDDMARHVLDTTPGPLVLIGLSLGGIVAASAAEQEPERIVGLGLLDSNLDAPGHEQLRTRHRWANQTRAGQFVEVVREMLPTLSSRPSETGPLIADMAMRIGPAGFLTQNRALVNRHQDRRPVVRRLSCPVLVLVGEEDALCPPSIHQDLANETRAGRLVVVPDAGHLSAIDQPRSVTSAVADWLEVI